MNAGLRLYMIKAQFMKASADDFMIGREGVYFMSF